MSCGAVGGLVLAGHVLFTARGTSTLVVPAEDVALVNQQPISRSDYLLQLQSLYSVDLSHASARQRKKVLDDMIREELFVQRGKELDVASTDPDVRSAMVNAVELEIAADATTAQPNEAALHAYYIAHQGLYASEGRMSVQDLVFPSSARAAIPQAIEALKLSAPTPSLIAQWNAKDSRKTDGEEFYFAAKIHLGDRLFDLAIAVSDGSTSPPIEMLDGIHVLYMKENRKPVPFDFAAARDRVLSDYRNEAISHMKAGEETFLRKRANVLIADDVR
jgi:hypothetical protein